MPAYLIESVIAFIVLMAVIPSGVYGLLRWRGKREMAMGIAVLFAIFLFLLCFIFIFVIFPVMFSSTYG